MNNLLSNRVHVRERVRRGSILTRAVRDLCRVSAQFRRAAGLVGALALVAPFAAWAQNNAVPARITTQISESSLTTLRGNTHPLARAQYDQGAVADSLPLHRMLLLLQRSPQQEAALRTLLDQQQSKTSPSYHQWLTPQQFGQQYGPATADIQTVTTWLQSHGFQIARVSTGGTLIEFSGTAGQVLNAFHTQIHRYLVNGQEHFANSTDPQIPTALVPVVAGPVSLHNFPKKPLSRKLGVFRKSMDTGKVTPLFTFSNGPYCGSSNCNALGPGDFATIYNVLKLWNPGINGTAIDGTGQTIAIVGDSEICTASMPPADLTDPNMCNNNDDVAKFRALFGLPTSNLPNVILDGPDPYLNGDEIEGDLDVEWSGAVAKGATIDFVIAETTESTDGTDLAAEYVVDNNLAPVLSESFGACEYFLGSGGNAFESTLWEQAAAQGITVIVAAGDSGSASCDDGADVAQFALAVSGVASTPFNVAAGGTDFDVTATNYQSTYWGGGGNATVGGINDVSATSYIPETSWNDSCAQNLTSQTISGSCTPEQGGITAGGGGQSNCIPGSDGNCDYLYGKPSWQTLPESGAGLTGLSGANPDTTRDLPDISLFSAVASVSNSFYVICQSDVDLNGTACNLSTSTPNSTPPYFDFEGVGGTSAAAPTFAGMMALVNQEMTILNSTNPQIPTRQGNANYVLYHLFSNQSSLNCSSSTGPNSGCTFNDVTKGNNSVPCTPLIEDEEDETFGCSTMVSGAYGVDEAVNLTSGALTGLYGFNAATGPDLATGLGSVNAFNLVSNWSGAAGAFVPTTTTLCLSATQIPTTETSCTAPVTAPITITHGQSMFVNIVVNGTGNTPIPVTESFSTTPSLTEDVALVGTFPSGNPSCNIPGCTTGGVDHFASNGTAPTGSTGIPNYFVSNADLYPLTSGVFSSATTSPTGENFTQYLTGGTYNVVAHYGGDGTYGASSSTSPMYVTVKQEGSTAETCAMVTNPATEITTGEVLLAPSSSPPYSCSSATTAGYGEFETIRVDVIGATSLQESATGSVTLTDNAAAIANPTGGTTSLFTLNTEGYFEDQTTYLAVGSHSFRATYQGDASYDPSAASAAIALTVTQAATNTTLTSNLNAVSSSQSVILTASVDTVSLGVNPTGSVSFFNSGKLIGTVPNNQLVSAPVNGLDAVQAVLTATLSASGSITATYSGDTNYVTSTTSSGVSITVNAPGVNTSSSGCSGTITISAPGGSGTCVIAVSGANSFAGAVTLSAAVTVEPSGAVYFPVCTFAPVTITLTTNGTGNSTMTCSTTATSGLYRPSSRPGGRNWPLVGASVSVICFLILVSVPRQRRWKLVPLAVLLVVVVAAGVSCSSGGGGGTGVNTPPPGTTTGNYTIAVTATPPSPATATTTTVTVDVM